MSQRLGQSAAQHGHLGLHAGGDADHVELAAPARGARVILHFERGPHRIERDEALQFERQRGDREFGVLEFFTRISPFFLASEGKALPQLGVVTVADRRTGENPQPPLGMADQDAGNRIHHQHGSLFGALLGLGENEVGDTAGFLIHAAGHVEIGKLETDRRSLFRRGGNSRVDQRVQPREKPFLAVLAPFVGVEERPHRSGRALGADVGRR